MNTKVIKLDINKKLYEIISAKQGDTKSRFILFNLYDGPIQFDLTDRIVRVYGKKKDNTTIFNDLVINDARKGYCTLELTNQILAVEGMNELELVIFEGEKRLSTMPFILNVIGSKYSEEAIVSTNEFTALMNGLKALSEYDTYKNEIKEARGGQVNLNKRLDKFNEQLEHKTYYCNSISEMKNGNYKKGDMIITLGFYYINDGGGGHYVVKEGTSDGYFSHELNNGLIAELICFNNTVNIKQLGARPKIDTNDYDIKPYINGYLSYLDTNNGLKLYIPSGIWMSSHIELIRGRGFYIYGDHSFIQTTINGTVINSIENEQRGIWSIGNDTTMVAHFTLKNLTFSSDRLSFNDRVKAYIFTVNPKKITGSALSFTNCQFGETDNLFFKNIIGCPIKLTSSWEIRFPYLNFREVSNRNGGLLHFAKAITTVNGEANLSALKFDYIMAEAVHGDVLYFENKCGFIHSHIGTINFEDFTYVCDGEVYTTFKDSNISSFNEETAEHFSIVRFADGGCAYATVIDNILLNNFAFRYHTYNGKNYVYDTILRFGNYSNCSLIINNIGIQGQNKNGYIVKQDNDAIVYKTARLSINNYEAIGEKSNILKVKNFPSLNINADITTQTQPKNVANSFTPFYETRKMDLDKEDGLITYDTDAINNKKLCIKPHIGSGNRVFTELYTVGTKFIMRAKIPSGQTVNYSMSEKNNSSNYIVLSCEGTGDFKFYEFDISSKFATPTLVEIIVGWSNTTIESLLDCFKFY